MSTSTLTTRSALSVLSQAVDEVAELLLAGSGPPDHSLGEELVLLGTCVERLAAVRASWAARFESSGAWALDGARSGSAWVAPRAHEHPASARSRVHAGRDLRDLPMMAAAAAHGGVRLAHVRLLASAARAKPHRWAAVAEFEALAAAVAADLTEPAFARYVARWAALVDAEHDDVLRADGIEVPVVDHAAQEEAERRELFLSQYGTDGMWALTGTLDAETGMALALALESVAEAIRGDGEPTRSLAHLRHDSLGVLLSGELSAGLPVHKGVRPRLLVVVGTGACGPAPGSAAVGPAAHLARPAAAELLDRTRTGARPAGVLPRAAPGSPAGAPRTGPPGSAPGAIGTGAGWISGLTRQRHACDAIVQAVVVDPSGVPLQLGRSARVVSPGLRRVIDLRDRHCTFAGCDAPPVWCQAHHLKHWEHGGATDERNLVLLCAFHHRAVHEAGFTLRWSVDGTRIDTLRPDGTLIDLGHPRVERPVPPGAGRIQDPLER